MFAFARSFPCEHVTAINQKLYKNEPPLRTALKQIPWCTQTVSRNVDMEHCSSDDIHLTYIFRPFIIPVVDVFWE